MNGQEKVLLDAEPGQAVYNRLTLSLYDSMVLGFSNYFAWRCPSANLLELYNRNLSASHLEMGVGTGYFLDHCTPAVRLEKLTLLDLNPTCLDYTAGRLRRYQPRSLRHNALEPFPLDSQQFGSVGLNYLLHCMPGSPEQKGVVFDHVKAVLAEVGVCFGSTIVNNGGESRLGGLLKMIYNRKGIFSNLKDTADAWIEQLEARFRRVQTQEIGAVLLFSARD
ncbi:SAM-dependent methyltransferase [Hahella chejuensis KCTC 2396]|uniref:SAM-dependent methyltransferase n=1 Tax=Hahella chejuensis (strain KCTC 2396) TaxID=349521 RepID=Q2SEK0_HAHCH|nr:class I SAM-dependent methyltransferase [Hahella chejuensis]ABC30924.1 SAM-dependent methyltransferase [Hahella chejuensis KCTC 2396]